MSNSDDLGLAQLDEQRAADLRMAILIRTGRQVVDAAYGIGSLFWDIIISISGQPAIFIRPVDVPMLVSR